MAVDDPVLTVRTNISARVKRTGIGSGVWEGRRLHDGVLGGGGEMGWIGVG